MLGLGDRHQPTARKQHADAPDLTVGLFCVGYRLRHLPGSGNFDALPVKLKQYYGSTAAWQLSAIWQWVAKAARRGENLPTRLTLGLDLR
jgi:hypothetical protein